MEVSVLDPLVGSGDLQGLVAPPTIQDLDRRSLPVGAKPHATSHLAAQPATRYAAPCSYDTMVHINFSRTRT
jgi:hypothetical protein